MVTKITLTAAANKESQTILTQDPRLTCVDGIFYDRRTDKIFIADSQKNAIQVLSPLTAP